MCSWFVPANRLYDIDSRTPIAHPAHQATDEDVRLALQDREIRADGGHPSSEIERETVLEIIAEVEEEVLAEDKHGASRDMVVGGTCERIRERLFSLQPHTEREEGGSR